MKPQRIGLKNYLMRRALKVDLSPRRVKLRGKAKTNCFTRRHYVHGYHNVLMERRDGKNNA